MLTNLRDEFRLRWKWWRLYRHTLQQLGQDDLTDVGIDAIMGPYDKGERRFLAAMTMRIEKQADWWAIDLPGPDERPEWWRVPDKGLPHLTHKGMARAKKMIQGERRASVTWWTDRIVPILALLVALAAVLTK